MVLHLEEKAEKLIEEGKVKVNGRIVLELGTKVNPGKDVVSVNGNYLDYATVEQIYLVMNKPKKLCNDSSDPEGRRTVLDLLPRDFGENLSRW